MAATLIKFSEKFAFAAFGAEIAGALPQETFLSPDTRVTRELPIDIKGHWTNWLGTIRSEYLSRDCNIFLYSSLISETAEVLDGENVRLMGHVSRLFEALLLTGNVQTRAPVLASGARDRFGINLRQTRETSAPLRPAGLPFNRISEPMLKEAFELMNARLAFDAMASYDRIQRVFYIFTEAQREHNPHERLHQFCRCVEGLILPRAGQTTRQFVSRTELFVGPRHHERIRRLYEMRSNVEHMHDYEFPADLAERDRRIQVMRMAALAESVAKYCLRHFLLTPAIWPSYATRDALASFWLLSPGDRQLAWGKPLDLAGFDRDFTESHFTDEALDLHP